jgi:hypothetical protein
MTTEALCRCGQPAAYRCVDCSQGVCDAHYCAGCGRCQDHCTCSYRYWNPFDIG